MAKALQLSVADRIGDAVFVMLVRMGISVGNMSLLTVRGRKSGQPRTIPVVLIEQDGERWLVAPYGAVQWVWNLRAAKTAKLVRGRRAETISVIELGAQEAAPVLKQYLNQVRVVRPYFDVTKDASLTDFESEAPQHPVFKIIVEEAAK